MKQLDLTDVTVRWISVSDMENNVYLITAKASGQQVLIDAADDAAAIADLVAAGSGEPLEAILTTHRHWDHVRALAQVAQTNHARTLAGVDDAQAIEAEAGAVVDEPLEHTQIVQFDGFALEVVALRGHTPGSVALVLRDSSGSTLIFSGDSLFPGGPGKTWSGEDFDSLIDDLETRIFDQFGDDVQVLPGHGASTTVGAERGHLGEWRERRW